MYLMVSPRGLGPVDVKSFPFQMVLVIMIDQLIAIKKVKQELIKCFRNIVKT